MSTVNKRFPFLYSTLLGMVIFLTAVISGQNVLAATGMSADGNYYENGDLTWSKISSGQYTYQEAVNMCDSKRTPDNAKWALPTPEQMKSFYQKVAYDSRNMRDWTLGMTWVATKAVANKQDAANLATGTFEWKGYQGDASRFLVACVAPRLSKNFVDGELTWAKIKPEKLNVYYAKQYCANLDRGTDKTRAWKLPTKDQLTKFNSAIASKRDVMLNAGWELGLTWSSDSFPSSIRGRATSCNFGLDLSKSQSGEFYACGDTASDIVTQQVACVR